MSELIPLVLLVISLVFSALISTACVVDALSSWLTYLVSSSSFPAKASMSSAKRKFVIVLPPMHTDLSRPCNASVMILSLSDSNCCPEPLYYSDCLCILCVVFLCFWYYQSFHSILFCFSSPSALFICVKIVAVFL